MSRESDPPEDTDNPGQRGETLETVKGVMQEYVEQLDDREDQERRRL